MMKSDTLPMCMCAFVVVLLFVLLLDCWLLTIGCSSGIGARLCRWAESTAGGCCSVGDGCDDCDDGDDGVIEGNSVVEICKFSAMLLFTFGSEESM